MDPIRISAPSFLDYIHSTPRGCVKIVKDQRKLYLDPKNKGGYFYSPIRTALRRAFNSVAPAEELARAVNKADDKQYAHFVALEAGFVRWSRKVKATGIKVSEAVWTAGNLDVQLNNLIGLRYANDKTEVVLPYLKEPELSSEAANLMLRVLEREMPHLLSSAHPMVLDVRRGKPFRLRRNTNRNDLDALLAGEAAKYTTHWQSSAA
ncbi:hypothetical protein OU415_34840 [Saccharopolyspora sp. WRP15-2]|uniref:Uncharacterized protein n=1 Tax=Saccharopolyspora oryzae TaxID=2997343 RepID=A0ABT4V9L3_9PSEU|nr:hypothetical protein [Saccharopolyspora oryzae]MDA3630649.1 hypothetical protein [Saccharopolyspora oryzae]